MPDTRLIQIRDIAASVFSATPKAVEDAESFVDDLEADSLLAIELLAQLEQRLDIAIPEADAYRMINLESTYAVVSEAAGW
ncbi:acyl carrier protein [Streptosporangium saharense]|uniref:acyl carrier protein n=1 Tax=Streptosporangium saharense TaxID=1706840 RepID=UPI0033287BFD